MLPSVYVIPKNIETHLYWSLWSCLLPGREGICSHTWIVLSLFLFKSPLSTYWILILVNIVGQRWNSARKCKRSNSRWQLDYEWWTRFSVFNLRGNTYPSGSSCSEKSNTYGVGQTWCEFLFHPLQRVASSLLKWADGCLHPRVVDITLCSGNGDNLAALACCGHLIVL